MTASDRKALESLTDIELIRDAKDPRAYELVFVSLPHAALSDLQHFADNDFFTNKTLSKKYTLPEGSAAAPADGSITDEIREFEPASLVAPVRTLHPALTDIQAVTIDWKEGKDLVQLHPRKIPSIEDLDDGDFEGDVGSWFHYFALDGDMFEIGQAVTDEVLQDPYKWFEGDDELSDEDDELDDEDDDEEGSVDLEDDDEDGPAKKKQRK